MVSFLVLNKLYLPKTTSSKIFELVKIFQRELFYRPFCILVYFFKHRSFTIKLCYIIFAWTFDWKGLCRLNMRIFLFYKSFWLALIPFYTSESMIMLLFVRIWYCTQNSLPIWVLFPFCNFYSWINCSTLARMAGLAGRNRPIFS